jgi:hypothetical protein
MDSHLLSFFADSLIKSDNGAKSLLIKCCDTRFQIVSYSYHCFLILRVMTPSSQQMESPAIPGRFTSCGMGLVPHRAAIACLLPTAVGFGGTKWASPTPQGVGCVLHPYVCSFDMSILFLVMSFITHLLNREHTVDT